MIIRTAIISAIVGTAMSTSVLADSPFNDPKQCFLRMTKHCVYEAGHSSINAHQPQFLQQMTQCVQDHYNKSCEQLLLHPPGW